MRWIEQVSGMIWTTDSFVDPATCQYVLQGMQASSSKNLRNSEAMSAKLAKIGINYNSYDYVIYQYDIRKELAVIAEMADSLDEVLTTFGQSAPRLNLNALQCFVKSFGPNSHYDVHVESIDRYGQWAWIHFLSDEQSGDLVFPDEDMLSAYLESHPEQVSAYQANCDLLASFGETVQTVGPFRMRPRYNHCILFRTGSPHWVEPMSEHHELTRPTATGWPHATQRMLDDLDRNCNINENFGHQ